MLWCMSLAAVLQAAFVNSELPPHLKEASDVTLAIYRHFSYNCLELIIAEELDISTTGLLIEFWRRLHHLDIPCSVVSFQTAHESQSYGCPTGRSIKVIVPFRYEYQNLREFSSGPVWILFVSNGSVESVLKHSRVPFDSQLIVAESINESVKLTEVYRMDFSNMLHQVTTGYWTPGTVVWKQPYKILPRRQLHGAQIRVASYHMPPFAEIGERDGTTVLTGGFFGELWNIMELRLNFTSIVTNVSDPSWEVTADNDGNWSQMTHLLLNHSVDVLVTDVTTSPEKSQVMDFLSPVITFRSQIYIRQPKVNEIQWKIFLEPLSSDLWFALVCILLLSACVSCLLRWRGRLRRSMISNDEEHWHHCVFEALFHTFRIFCMQGLEQTPQTISAKMVCLSCYISSVVVFTSYSAVIIARLAVNRIELPFSSLYGLQQDGTYQLGMLANSPEYLYFSSSKDNLIHNIFEKFMRTDPNNFPDEDGEGIRRACVMNFAYMVPYEYVRDVLREAPCTLMAIPGRYFQVTTSLAVKKGSQYRHIFDRSLRKLRDDGIARKVHDKAWPPSMPEEEPFTQGVSIGKIVPLMTMLTLGILVITLALLLEMAKYHCHYVEHEVDSRN